ncbi:MAG: molybdopterin molybdotransferase MoeA [Candidatus Dormibacteria bacterium]
MQTVDGARRQILQGMAALPTERVNTVATLGRVLAHDVISERTVPAFANASMDGYAVVAASTLAPPQVLRVVGSVRAGHDTDGCVAQGTAMRISTGALLPVGADAVVCVEDTDNGNEHVKVAVSVQAGTAVRHAGEDVTPGDAIVTAGTRLCPADLAAATAVGQVEVVVHRQPRVAILATGDELVPPGTDLRHGQVVDCITPALAAAVCEAGGIPIMLGIARDDPVDVRSRLQPMDQCDLIISVGGVSVGEHDHVRDVVSELGRIDFWRVALRPGKPLVVGRIGGIPFIGLPGNPVSALVTFEVFVRPAILALQNASRVQRQHHVARLDGTVETPANLETYVRGVISNGDGPLPTVVPVSTQSSGATRSLAAADCLIMVAADVEVVEPGTTVRVIPLR